MKRVSAFLVCLVVMLSCVVPANAATYRKTTTRYYSCRAHSNCMHITFSSHGNTSTGDVYDYYFSGNHSHWPNAFRYDSTWSYKVRSTGYAKGTYTAYSSLVTQWASLSFSSTSSTITHVY